MAVISASGVVSPVGINTLQTFTSVRALIKRMTTMRDLYTCMPANPDFPPDDEEHVVVSYISYLETVEGHARRLAFLASRALACMMPASAMDAGDYKTAGLFMALPPVRRNWGPSCQDEFLYYFYNYLGIDPLPHQEFSHSGNAGALLLLESALRSLQSGRITRALLGGVDSYLFEDWLGELDDAYRLKSSRNVDGFTPGECAAFVLLERDGEPEKRGLTSQLLIEKTGGMQCGPAELISNTGLTLSRLISGMLEGVDAVPVFICDLNGEPPRMKEWGYVLSRLGERLGVPCLYEHPVNALGDMGAASGAVLTALSFHYLTRKFQGAGKTRAMIWAASDGGDRAAVMVKVNPAAVAACRLPF